MQKRHPGRGPDTAIPADDLSVIKTGVVHASVTVVAIVPGKDQQGKPAGKRQNAQKQNCISAAEIAERGPNQVAERLGSKGEEDYDKERENAHRSHRTETNRGGRTDEQNRQADPIGSEDGVGEATGRRRS